jgi:NADH-quinone oxidoreductase E subunit
MTGEQMSFAFTAEDRAEIDNLVGRYPDKQSALLPLLHLVQRRDRWLEREALRAIAEELELPLIHVEDVATFYTMYNLKPVGRHHLQVCGNLSCSLLGAADILAWLKQKYGISPGETDSDGRFTLTKVECLGACGGAPVVQIDDDYYENCTPEKLEQILEKLE